jgi:hypothetical protein
VRHVLLIALVAMLIVSCSTRDSRLDRASRTESNGWIAIHLAGPPRTIGYQHGALLAPEIDDLLKTMASFVPGATRQEWEFYRQTAGRLFWPRLEREQQEEIEGIVEGLRSRGFAYDSLDITALNAWIEIAYYYIPYLANLAKADSMNNRAPGNCSAFIATGSWTADGRIVVAHNNWTDYIIGERWNVIADIVPEWGERMLMDMLPGYIHSGDDFAINGAGLLYTETTITQFRGFDTTGVPEFSRARKAAQYGRTIDDFVRIMVTQNNGAYANTWLIGDLKANEIAKLDLGLKHHRLWRTRDGIYVGSNFGTDEALLHEETLFDAADATSSPNARKTRWEQLAEEYRGRLDAETAKILEADHVDATTGEESGNRCAICGHVDLDSIGVPQWSNPPYYPTGAVQGKVTTAALAAELKMWARMGHPCGKDFLAAEFLARHPEYRWQEKHLRDMKGNPWTLFEARR